MAPWEIFFQISKLIVFLFFFVVVERNTNHENIFKKKNIKNKQKFYKKNKK